MSDDDTIGADQGIAAVAAAMADGWQEDKAWLAKLGQADPKPGESYNGDPPGYWKADEFGLPPDCPVIPLGVDGDLYWFLDTVGQLRSLEYNQFGQSAINSLFMGRHFYLYWAWPRKNKEGEITAWRAEKAREDLMNACARKGAWNAVEQARGRGAWKLSDGRLAIHCGSQLFVDGKAAGLGELMGDVYMTRPPILTPWPKPIGAHKGPAAYLLPMLRTWNWARPDIDPILMLGWLAAAAFGGALPWRPVVYVTGDKATGKSSLQNLIKALYSRALIKTADTTAAGIYQLLKSDALPVAVDELEGKADTRRAKAIIELARLASSGDLMLRGGEAHSGTQFNARSCFMFSSINTPPLEPQDLSRMALLKLYRLPKGSVAPDHDEAKLARTGRMIMRQMSDGWPRFPSVWQAYRKALAEAGHDSRGQDTFGTLLACADILIGNDADILNVPMGSNASANLSEWSELLAADKTAELEDAIENWRLCLNLILSTPIEAWRGGGQQTMGKLLEELYHNKIEFNDAKAIAQNAGLTLLEVSTEYPQRSLFIPNQHPNLHRLLKDTKFAGEPGAGIWSGSLRQAYPPGIYRVGQARVTGVKCKGTIFSISTVLERTEGGRSVWQVQDDQV